MGMGFCFAGKGIVVLVCLMLIFQIHSGKVALWDLLLHGFVVLPDLIPLYSFCSYSCFYLAILEPLHTVECNVFANGTTSVCRSPIDHNTRLHSKQPLGNFGEYKLSPNSFSQEIESFLLNTISMNFFDRLNLAWKIMFPSPTSRRNSNANIAKQRLKMILFSDRCAVSDEAKQKIVSNVVNALSDFVEIESQDKVQLSVSTDLDLGTIYSVRAGEIRVSG
ncbi:UNVERIFIED_CONTAM: Cell division topological specificity factor, chloroplastic [Sesamum calycinum]|uniref:Cell division topological specificity factor, chloroplastic n=1 Tax=Sesamum calycinum TaxID=2727403 RepID=A0AAW2QXJ5_9LAMI